MFFETRRTYNNYCIILKNIDFLVYSRDSEEKFIQNMEEFYLKLNQQKRKFFFVGNFNIDLLQINSNLGIRNNADSLIRCSCTCKCLIDVLTRVNHNSATLINHIFTSLLNKWLVCGVAVADISDHDPTFH